MFCKIISELIFVDWDRCGKLISFTTMPCAIKVKSELVSGFDAILIVP